MPANNPLTEWVIINTDGVLPFPRFRDQYPAATPAAVDPTPPTPPKIKRVWIEAANDDTGDMKIMYLMEGWEEPSCYLYVSRSFLELLGPAAMEWLVKRERTNA